jgi:hypothetical protein
MVREVPGPLYQEVFALAEAITQPLADSPAEVDSAVAAQAYAALRALNERLEAAGQSDPFVTEALADFTEDSEAAIALYYRALEQCPAFPGEVAYTKRIGLARQLISVGRNAEALEQVASARREAFAAGDTDALRDLGEIHANAAA